MSSSRYSLACRRVIVDVSDHGCCGGTSDVETIFSDGSTRKNARILRCPGRVGSARRNAPTRCCSTFGKARQRPAGVRSEERRVGKEGRVGGPRTVEKREKASRR